MKRDNQKILRAPLFDIWIFSFMVALAHALFCYEYFHVPLEKLVVFDVPPPFVHRVLPSLLGYIPVHLLGVPGKLFFGVINFFALACTCVVARRILTTFFDQRFAKTASLVFLLLLLVPLTITSELPIFYPWDIPSVMVLTLGLWWSIERKAGCVFWLTLVGTFNRETALILPVVYLVTGLPSRKETLMMGLAMLLGIGAKILMMVLFASSAGATFSTTLDSTSRMVANGVWLVDHPLIFLCSVGGIPVLWMLFSRRIPVQLNLLVVPCVLLLSAVFCLANVYESRTLLEFLTLSFFPAVVGGRGWWDAKKVA